MKTCPNCAELLGDSVNECFNCNYSFQYNRVLTNDERKQQREMIKQLEEEERLRLKKEERLRLEEEKCKQEQKNNQLLRNPRFEYRIVVVDNLQDGAINQKEIQTELSYWSENGWRLHSIFNNELGKTSTTVMIAFLGTNINATIDQTVLIFERCIKSLVNIRSQLQDLIDTIDSLKFGGEAIANITSVDTFKSKASVNTSSIGLTNGEINSYANTLLGQKFTPDTIPTMKHENDSKYNLQINPETGAVDTPDLYEYFHSVYKNTPKDQMDKAKSEKETAKETASNAESDAKDADRYSGGGADVPWEFSNNTSYSAIEGLSGLIGVVKDLINLDFSNMRDDLYVTTYIMEMFSYGTFENEGLYKLLGETDPDKLTELTLGNYTGENYYGSVKGSSPDDEKSWMSKDPQVTQNKTLTNKLINKTNNQAYGAEVEYILYGSKGSTNVDNVKAAYSNIYVIRYGLNVVSGFQHFWNPLGTKSDATATALYMAGLGVQTATAGIVPIAVTEAVLIPILTIFETSKDLDRLQAGFPVELYKSEPGMWWVSLSGSTGGGIGAFMTALSNGELLGGKNNTNNGLFYSDYLTLFVYLGLNSSAQEGMYQRIAEVIQFNIGKQVPADAGVEKYSLKKSIVYFQLQATVRVKPLMITLPIFNDYENNMSTSTDWCTYTINIRRGYS